MFGIASRRRNMEDFLTCEVRTVGGETLGLLVLKPKEFTSGSTGFFGQGKLELEGERYQAQAQLVKIGSRDRERYAAQTPR
jgi:hypothetical protein